MGEGGRAAALAEADTHEVRVDDQFFNPKHEPEFPLLWQAVALGRDGKPAQEKC
jgi:hypothetical protein